MSASTLLPILLPAPDDRYPMTSVDVDGVAWDVSCNGYAMIARRTTTPTFEPPTEARKKVGYVDFIKRPATGPRRVSLAELLQALGAPETEKDERCSYCAGGGWSYDRDGDCDCANCRCSECDGGVTSKMPPSRPRRLFGQPVNANLVAVALDALSIRDEATVDVYVTAEPALRIYGSDWMAIIMCRTETSMPVDAPSHFAEAP